MWQDAFAISVGLLNDCDIGKPDNMGILINVIQNTIKVCLLDLAYQSIDKAPCWYFDQQGLRFLLGI